jgi:hypothetical protein
VDELAKLISRLQRLGYRTQTFGTEIVVEFDSHSKLRGSASQIERILPRLEKGFKPAARLVKPTTGKKKGKRKKGKIKVTSAKVPTVSLETQSWARTTGWRKSRSPGGLPGLGKHR